MEMWEHEKRTALRALARAERTRQNAEAVIVDLVRDLREPDENGKCAASWQEIGEALWVTRQSAQERFTKHL